MSLLLRGPSASRLSRGGRPHRWRINCRMNGRRPSRRGSICVAMRPAIALAFALLAPTAHTSDGATAVTTTTTSATETLSSVGPQVKLTLNWSYRETTKDKTSGATLVDISEDRTMVGAINVCPDQEGAVGAFVDVKD